MKSLKSICFFLQAPYNTVTYQILGGDANARTYFRIDEVTGNITTLSSLSNDAAGTYRVSTSNLFKGNNMTHPAVYPLCKYTQLFYGRLVLKRVKLKKSLFINHQRSHFILLP